MKSNGCVNCQQTVAYNLNGIAARLAYSIGLNVESLHRSLGFDREEARRTWAIIYIQEIELSLDAGRPISIRSADMNMNYPTVQASCFIFRKRKQLLTLTVAGIKRVSKRCGTSRLHWLFSEYL